MVSTDSLNQPAQCRPLDRDERDQWLRQIDIDPAALVQADFNRLYPFESRLHPLGGQQYHHLDEGTGEPVVMVHGNPTWSFFYRDLVKTLRATRRCLAPDHIGCGFSSKPQNYDYRLEQHIDNLEDWLETVLPAASEPDGQFDLVLHDWGGPIGMGYAIRHPERIKRLVILNTSVFTAGDMPFRIKLCRWPLVGTFAMRGLNAFARGAARWTTISPLPQEVRRGFVLPYSSWNNRIGIDRFVKDIPLARNTPTYHVLETIQDRAQALFANTPILLQWGLSDWCFSQFFLELWKKAFPSAEVDVYQAGHYLLEDAGSVIIPRICEYLERPAG